MSGNSGNDWNSPHIAGYVDLWKTDISVKSKHTGTCDLMYVELTI